VTASRPTRVSGCRLRVEVNIASSGQWLRAEYDNMTVQSEASNYTLHVTGYHGNAGDAFNDEHVKNWRANGMPFSTPDVDNDQWTGDQCAGVRGWWFRKCSSSCINGFGSTVSWYSARGTKPPGIHRSRSVAAAWYCSALFDVRSQTRSLQHRRPGIVILTAFMWNLCNALRNISTTAALRVVAIDRNTVGVSVYRNAQRSALKRVIALSLSLKRKAAAVSATCSRSENKPLCYSSEMYFMNKRCVYDTVIMIQNVAYSAPLHLCTLFCDLYKAKIAQWLILALWLTCK